MINLNRKPARRYSSSFKELPPPPEPKPASSGKFRRKPKLHKGKMECCPCCNPSGYRRAQRADREEKRRKERG